MGASTRPCQYVSSGYNVTIQIELWQLLTFLIGLLLAFLTFAFGAGKLLLSQIDQRLDERFDSQEDARAAAQTHWDLKFGALEQLAKQEANQWQRLDRDLLQLRADLPLQYVRREDWIRQEVTINAKLDALAAKIDTLNQRGANNGS